MRRLGAFVLALLSGLLLTACSSPAEKASQHELDSIKLAAPFTTVKSGFQQHSAYRQYAVPKDRFTPAAVLVPQSYRRIDAPLGATSPFEGWQTMAAWIGKSSDGKYDCLVSLYMAPDIDAVVSGLTESQRQMVRNGSLVLARINSQCGPW
jgi:hypothetical protein